MLLGFSVSPSFEMGPGQAGYSLLFLVPPFPPAGFLLVLHLPALVLVQRAFTDFTASVQLPRTKSVLRRAVGLFKGGGDQLAGTFNTRS